MTTPAAQAMRAVVAELRPVLTAAGFRKRRHIFNRTTEPGLVQVVGFHMGRVDPPGTVEIPGIRESVQGLFSVHLGVYVEEVWRLEFGPLGRDVEPEAKSWVNDYDCQIRGVMDNPAGDPLNRMWRLDDLAAVHEVRDGLHARALPWLDRYGSRAAILARVERVPVLSAEISGVGPNRLLATRMLLTAGDRTGAQDVFDDYVDDCLVRAPDEPHVRGHLQYLADFAERTGLAMPSGHRSEEPVPGRRDRLPRRRREGR
jgi:hypothetical protein